MNKKDLVYITGHKNPDSDSICAAIAYGSLKNRIGKVEAIPIRQGEINRETQFILDYFNIEAPILKTTMKPKVSELDFDSPKVISKDTTINKALNIIRSESNSTLQVVGDREELIGVVTLSNITNSYMDIWDENILGRSGTTLDNILEVLRAEIKFLPENPRELSGRMTVFAMEPGDIDYYISENDLVIVGNRDNAQKKALELGVSLLILTIGSEISEENLEIARKNNVTVISTELNTFLASRLLPLSIPVEHVMTTENIIKFRYDEYVDDIKRIMANSRFRSYPIVNDKNQVVGSISRYHLISNKKKSLILVDHNEKNQSVGDIDSAEIIEIIDHHRVANIATDAPIFFRNMPVGSTSTIISMMYFEKGVVPSKEIAGILSAAIISDTLLLRSPTSTDTDRRMLERMARIAGIDIESFAMEMFKHGTSIEGKSPDDLLNEDMKQFDIYGEPIRVAQVFTMDLDGLVNIKEDLVNSMEEIVKREKISTYVMVFTDIISEVSEIIPVGMYTKEIAEEFNAKDGDVSFRAKGVLSRKKQVIPPINSAVAKAKEV